MPYEASRPASPPASVDENYWSNILHQPVYDSQHTSSDLQPPVDSPGTPADWAELASLRAADASLSLPVVGSNRGGLLVEWHTLRGFVPASQLTDFPIQADETVRQDAMAEYIGQQLNLRIIELNPDRNRLIE